MSESQNTSPDADFDDLDARFEEEIGSLKHYLYDEYRRNMLNDLKNKKKQQEQDQDKPANDDSSEGNTKSQ